MVYPIAWLARIKRIAQVASHSLRGFLRLHAVDPNSKPAFLQPRFVRSPARNSRDPDPSSAFARSHALIAALSQVAARLETTLDPDRIMETLGEQLKKLGINCFVALLAPGEEVLINHYFSFTPDALAQVESIIWQKVKGFRLPRERFAIYPELVHEKRAVYVPDWRPLLAPLFPGFPMAVLEQLGRLADAFPDTRVLYLPLKLEREVLGAMGVWGRGLEEQDLSVFSIFAAQVAGALYAARLHQQLQTHQVQEAVRASEARFRALIENSSDAVTLVDAQGRIIYSGSSSERLWGYEVDQFKERTAFELVHPDDRDAILAKFAELVRTPGGIVTAQYRLQHKDGSWRWAEGTAHNLLNDPSVQAIVINASDITERKSAEEALLASEQQYRALYAAARRQAQDLALLDRVRTAIARELDLPIVFRTVVEAIAQTFGYTQVSLYRHEGDVLTLQHQVGYDHVIEQIPVTQGISGNVVRTGKPVLLEDVRTDPEFLGAIEGIVSEVCVPLFDQARVVGTLNVESTQGVTLSESDLRLIGALSEQVGIAIERARLYTEVRESEERFAKAFRASPAALSITRLADGRFVDVNASFLELFGYEREEVIDHTSIELDMYPYPEERAKLVWLLREQGSVRNYGMTTRTKSGEIRNVLFSTEEFELNNEAHILATIVDITERQRAEDELQLNLDMTTRLYRLSGQILAATTLEDTARLVTTELRDGFQAYSSSIYLFDDQERLEFQAGVGLPQEIYTQYKPRPEGMAYRVLHTGEPLIVTDPNLLHPAIRGQGIQTAILLPLRDEEKTRGVLFLDYDSVHPVSERELQALLLFANHAALALKRARLFYETHRRVVELETVNKVSTALRAAQTIEEVLPLLIDQTLAVFNTHAGVIWLMAPDRMEMYQAVRRGWFEQVEAPMRPGEGIGGHVFSSGVPYCSREFLSDPRTRAAARPQIPPGWGGACVPVRAADKIIGVIFVSVQLPRELTDAEVHLLTTLAEIAGNTIHRMRLHRSLEDTFIQTIAALAHAIDARDNYTSDHSTRVSDLAVGLAQEMGLPREAQEDIRLAGLLHDIGKIAIPDSILHKPGLLTSEEWTFVKKHPIVGADILRPIEQLKNIVPIVRHHQEKFDGTGYPDGLTGDAIPFGARILSVVDAFSSITDDRTYRKPRSEAEALEELRRNAGIQFDPRVVEVFVRRKINGAMDETSPPG